jgi:endonuclease YncB( thermonuclease family)
MGTIRFVGLSMAGIYARRLAPVSALLIAIALIAFFQPISPPQAALQAGPSAFLVIDGDTIRSPAGVRYRLLGYDSPETFYAKCDASCSSG